MWSRLPTIEECLDCKPPFSFYFDLVGIYWRNVTDNSLPLHRACTLARKQGVTFCTISSAFDRPDVLDEIDTLDAAYGGGGAAEAITVAFFKSDISPANIQQVPDDGILGHAVLINYREPGSSQFSLSYIYEAIFRRPKPPGRLTLPNNHICRDAEFPIRVSGRTFSVRGVYYGQQNAKTNVCAHACLRMALNSIGSKLPPVTNSAINKVLGAAPPFPNGLSLQQIRSVIDNTKGVEAAIYPCKGLPDSTYLSTLAAIIESGNLALLGFTTGNGSDHVVTVFGHTQNTDEWHPQAIPAYAGPQSAQYYGSSAWIDHFLIHDDNFGPYYTLSTRALEVASSVKPLCIIAIWDIAPKSPPAFAEVLAAVTLSNVLPSLAGQSVGKWFEYITKGQWIYVLRTIYIEKTKYLEHLKSSCGHDGSRMDQQGIQFLASLPERFWMVEFSLPSLHTGNHSKLGEVIIDAMSPIDPQNPAAGFLALRLPSLILLNIGGQVAATSSSLASHSLSYSSTEDTIEW